MFRHCGLAWLHRCDTSNLACTQIGDVIQNVKRPKLCFFVDTSHVLANSADAEQCDSKKKALQEDD